MCEIERHRYPCCRRVREKYRKNASFCQSMEPGARCDKIFHMFVGKIQEHKEGMCPACLKDRAAEHAHQRQNIQYAHPSQRQHHVKQELDLRGRQVQSCSLYEHPRRYGGPPSGPTSGHPSSQPADLDQGFENFIGASKPQYSGRLSTQLLPQNLAAHTPIPIPRTRSIEPDKATSPKALYSPLNSNFGGRGMLKERPVFEPPPKRPVVDTANGKQGVGMRKTASTMKPKSKGKRSYSSEDEDDDYEPRPTKTRAFSRAPGQIQWSPPQSVSEPAPASFLQPPLEQQSFTQDYFSLDSAPYGNPDGFQMDFFSHLNDLNQPTGLSQPLEIYVQPQQLQQLQQTTRPVERYIQPQQLQQSQTQHTQYLQQAQSNQNAYSQYPQSSSYDAYEGQDDNNGGHNQGNTGYNPPIFGQSFPFDKPLTPVQPFDTYDNNGNAFTDEELMWSEVDWTKVDEDLANSNAFFVPSSLEPIDGTDPTSASQGTQIPSAINLPNGINDLEMNTPMQAQHTYSFPGSMLPMPLRNDQGQKTEIAREIPATTDVKIDVEEQDDPLSPLFPED